MVFDNDIRTVFILSPMAVHPDYQKRGIGQTLIRKGIDALQDEGVDIILTYGDPAFYSKTGFKTITNKDAKPPYSLSQPQGWLMCDLAGENTKPLKGNSTCAPALMNSDLW